MATGLVWGIRGATTVAADDPELINESYSSATN